MLVQIATAMAIGAYVVLSKDAHQNARTHIVDPIDQERWTIYFWTTCRLRTPPIPIAIASGGTADLPRA
jgi:hypothetical protein